MSKFSIVREYRNLRPSLFLLSLSFVSGSADGDGVPQCLHDGQADIVGWTVGNRDGADALGALNAGWVDPVCLNRADSDMSSTCDHCIRFVYMVPSDRSVRGCYEEAIEMAARHLQHWIANHTSDRGTFLLHDPAVEILETPHPAAWYASNPVVGADHGVWFWLNALRDGFDLTGGRFDDPQNRWVFYLDADPACGQLTGGTNGVALLPANDLRGLTGQTNVSPCGGQGPDTFGLCRWIGGLGHELGHALGLPHPDACEDNDPTTQCPHGALMWTGYSTYPTAFLTEQDQESLGSSDFVLRETTYTAAPFDCSLVEFDNCYVVADANGDWNVDLDDFVAFVHCWSGLASSDQRSGFRGDVPSQCLELFDLIPDGAIDLKDFAALQRRFTGTPEPE